MIFDRTTTTDAKRVVRGEHYLMARGLLRVRDGVHHSATRIVILAGGNPAEELGTIRHLWSRAVVTAIDADPRAVAAAADAGADVSTCSDLGEWLRERIKTIRDRSSDPNLVDVMVLDFCGTVTDEMVDLLRLARRAVSNRGVVLLTFSYGRDVVERFLATARGGYLFGPERSPLIDLGVPESVAGRILTLANVGPTLSLRAVSLYPGASMPMCATVWQHVQGREARDGRMPSVAKFADCDLDDLIVHPDPAQLYATPQQRVLSARRRAAAAKAVATRRDRTAK